MSLVVGVKLGAVRNKTISLNPEYSDASYDLPPLDVRWHEIPIHYGDSVDRDGQMQLFQEAAEGLKEAAASQA